MATANERARHLGVVIGAAVFAALFVTVMATWAVLSVRHDRARDHRDMEAGRTSSCVRFNQNQQAARDGQVNGFVTVIQSFGPAVKPDLVATVRAGAEAAARRSFPYRACTDEEIDNYLSTGQTDPAAGCPGDGHGYCKEAP